MAKAKAARPDTWMPLYWGDYFKDTGHLSTAEHGAYLLLIGHYWSTGKALPDDDAKLAQITRQPQPSWRKMRETLAEFFEVDTVDGLWRHGRVEHELGAAEAFIDQRSAAGKASAEARKRQREGNDRSTEAQREGKTSPSPSQSPESVTTTPTVCDNARGRATHTQGRAGLIPLDWEPSAADLAALRKGRPDLTGPWYETQMAEFRDWCSARAVTSHDPTATWRGFMRKAKPPPDQPRESFEDRRLREGREKIAELAARGVI